MKCGARERNGCWHPAKHQQMGRHKTFVNRNKSLINMMFRYAGSVVGGMLNTHINLADDNLSIIEGILFA